MQSDKTLYILFQPKDRAIAQLISKTMKKSFAYNSPIKLTPLSNQLAQKQMIITDEGVISIQDLNNALVNKLALDEWLQTPSSPSPHYPNDSIILMEYSAHTHKLTKAIWAYETYLDDLGVFTSRDFRKKQLRDALKKLDKLHPDERLKHAKKAAK